METMQGRRCRICGALISDTNPDGIGATCREVFYKADTETYYHFEGLYWWGIKAQFWAEIFIDVFSETKFRSDFHRNFYESILKQHTDNKYRISSKMLRLIQDRLFYKLGDIREYYEKEKEMLRKEKMEFHNNITYEQEEYRMNLAKKYYNKNKLLQG